MSPLRPGRKLFALLLLGTFFLAAAAPLALAQDAPAAKSRTLELNPQEDNAKCPKGKGPCWDVQTLVANPGDHVHMIINFTGSSQPHDFHITVDGQELKVPDKPAIGGVYTLDFTFPTGAKKLEYFCNVHKGSMFGTVKIQSELGATEVTAVPELGVHFLAYWVGVIAFMLLFLVYGLTFFLFKYNETPAATDHWDRTGGEGLQDNPRMRGGAAALIAIGIAVIVIAGIVYLARYLRS